jgi:hypothetical protein
MHKAVLCLTKAESGEDAISNVEGWLAQYQDDVFDWYQIGGRWSGLLNQKSKEFVTKTNEYLKSIYPDFDEDFVTDKLIKENATKLQEIWEGMGETTKNPYTRSFENFDGSSDDSVPLTQCLSIIKEWTVNVKADAEEAFKKLLEAREEEKEKGGTMSAYYAGIYRNLIYDAFSTESNIYDIENETNDPEQALKEPEQWFVVLVDLHH